MSRTNLKVVMGAMTFGKEGTSGARVHDIEEVKAILDIFQKHGHKEVDTARNYAAGTSESFLAQVGWQERGLVVDTKLYPTGARLKMPDGDSILLTAKDIREHFGRSLEALNTDSVGAFFLHGPDRSTPLEETLKTVDELYKEGRFKRFGLSNFCSWEVAEVCVLCRVNGWVQPTIYEGLYNAVHRSVEAELFPVLRKYGMSFHAFNPLGGGLFTGRYRDMNANMEAGSRFDPNTVQGKFSRARYWNDAYFRALDIMDEAVTREGLTMPEVALRWLSHHSNLKPEHDDAVIVGASSTKHLEHNLVDLEKGPLPDSVVAALDQAWYTVRGSNVDLKYWH